MGPMVNDTHVASTCTPLVTCSVVETRKWRKQRTRRTRRLLAGGNFCSRRRRRLSVIKTVVGCENFATLLLGCKSMFGELSNDLSILQFPWIKSCMSLYVLIGLVTMQCPNVTTLNIHCTLLPISALKSWLRFLPKTLGGPSLSDAV